MSPGWKTSQESVQPEEGDTSEALAEGRLYDFVTNEPVPDSPAERTLQTVARSLVDEYQFDHTQLRRDQTLVYPVIDDQGKQRQIRRKAEIAVYPEGVRRDDQNQIIRICLVVPPMVKGTDEKRGVALLEEVMGALAKCDYGLWTNGTDLVFKQRITGGGRIEPEYVDLYDLPGYGESASDLDRPDRQVGRIATGDNLQRTFARVHDYIYGNQGLKKDVAFWQVLNLIFCKIHDEQTPGPRRGFWVKGTERNSPEGQHAIAQRIKNLFDEVKKSPSYASVFSDRDQIDLNDRVLAFAVGELSRYTLKDADVDVKGAAYEEITASTLKAQRGQFFTPTNVIRLMIQMMDPGGDSDLTNNTNWPRIMDPACGSGRFLTYALDHVRRKLAAQLYPAEHPLLQVHRLEADDTSRQLVRVFAERCLYGIDFDPDLKRAARMNMILNNDGHGNILSFNSLEYPLMLGATSVAELRDKYSPRQGEMPDHVRARLDAHFDTFDFVFTNPPFGAKIPVDDPLILRQFDLGHRWSQDAELRWVRGANIQSAVPPEILFVERCVQWVKPGTGKVAIVLPDGILGNPDAEHIRYWILTHCQVLASIDLPVEAFLPQVGVQASLLFLRRKSQAEMDAEALGKRQDYPVFMGVAETVGHDRRGNTVYLRDADGTEVVFKDTYDVLQRRHSRLIPTQVTRNDKRVDDDLPRIAEVYQQYLLTGHVPT